MTTLPQVKKLVGPLLERHADLILVGRIVVLRPVHHIMRGIMIDRTGEADRFNPRWAVNELFEKLNHFPLGLGDRLYRTRPDLWLLSEPGISRALVEVVERDALPRLRAIATLQDLLEFMLPKDPDMLKYYWGPRFTFAIALGDLDFARALLSEAPGDKAVAMLNRHAEGLGDRLRESGDRLSSEDRLELARFLRDCEAYTAGKLKVAHIWERAPFPIELQAERSR